MSAADPGNGSRNSGRFGSLKIGAPVWALAAVAAGCLVWLAYTSGRVPSPAVRGYADFVVNQDSCYVELKTSLNAFGCRRIAANTFAIDFSESLRGSVAVANPAPCCPNSIAAVVVPDRQVTVRLLGRPHYPALASVVVP